MVDAVSPVSASASSYATRAETSLSITSEPDNAWVAARQSHITADLLGLKAQSEQAHHGVDRQHDESEALDDRHPHKRHDREASAYQEAEDTASDHLLSGESERIGTQNFDDDTPFGERVAIV